VECVTRAGCDHLKHQNVLENLRIEWVERLTTAPNLLFHVVQ